MEIKKIKLKADKPFFNYVDINVLDYPKGIEYGETRKRCVIRVEFGEYDVQQLIKQGKNYEEAIEYYRDYIYDIVKVNIGSDWECMDGMDEITELIRKRIKTYY